MEGNRKYFLGLYLGQDLGLITVQDSSSPRPHFKFPMGNTCKQLRECLTIWHWSDHLCISKSSSYCSKLKNTCSFHQGDLNAIFIQFMQLSCCSCSNSNTKIKKPNAFQSPAELALLTSAASSPASFPLLFPGLQYADLPMYLGCTKLFPTPGALRLAISFAWGPVGSTFPKSTRQPEWSF